MHGCTARLPDAPSGRGNLLAPTTVHENDSCYDPVFAIPLRTSMIRAPRPSPVPSTTPEGATRPGRDPKPGPDQGITLRLRHWLGLAIVAAGLLAWLSALLPDAGLSGYRAAGALSGIAALATALGVLPMLTARAPAQRTQDTMLGFGAGVMLAATCFSLLIPALAEARALAFGPWQRGIGVATAMLIGAACLMALERLVPHVHLLADDQSPEAVAAGRRARRVTLFVLAIVLHNVPEGLAIGVAVAGSTIERAAALATGIAIQDVPEGLIVALALHSAGMRRGTAALLGAASGLVEPLAAVAAVAAVSVSSVVLPWALAWAAGAMLFVVSHEVIPESHRQGHERFATTGLLAGFALMMVLDTALA